MKVATRTNVICWRLFPIEQVEPARDGYRPTSTAEVATTHLEIAGRLNFVELVRVAAQNRIHFGNDFTHSTLTPAQRVWSRLMGDRAGFENQDPRFQSIGHLWEPERPATVPRVEASRPDEEEPPAPERPIDSVPRTEPLYCTQEAFLECAKRDSCFVIAAPGTGKTHVLVSALNQLVGGGDIESPADEIATLTFSRAAVAALRNRISATADASGLERLRYVRIQTFDSFVTQLLLKEELQQRLAGMGYEQRIRYFVDGYRNLPECMAAVSRIRFLFIDEVQDLVGSRADLTLLLAGEVQKAGGVVALLGDPAQAIYDWQIKEKPEATTSGEFMEQALDLVGERVLRFGKSYRFAEGPMSELASDLREALGEGDRPDSVRFAKALSRLPTLEMQLAALSEFAKAEETCAVLARDNLEVWQITDWLRNNGIPVEAWRGVRGGHWPGWIARVFHGWKGAQMRLSTFETRCASRIGNDFDVQSAVALLRQLEVLADEVIDVERLRYCIRTQAAPAVAPKGGIVVSTIHRSKGLEFDRVVMLEPSSTKWQGNPEELRVIYVAATRAKKALALLGRDSGVLSRGRRLWHGHFHVYRSDSGINQLLVDGYEDSIVDTPDTSEFEVSHELLSGLKPSAEIEFIGVDKRYGMRISGHTAVVPGRFASWELGGDLRNLERRFARTSGIQSLTGLKCVDLGTAVLDERAMEEVGAEFAGFYLVPVLSGLGTVVLN